MIEAPSDSVFLDELYKCGLNEVGMNIEIWNRSLAKKLMPGKGSIPLRRYLGALEHAVSIWGSAGAVRSILIAGLEPLESTLKGVEELAKRHVMPILSPFRPVPNTPAENHSMLDGETMFRLWVEAQDICENHGMTLGPLCVCCQNNTISAPLGDKYIYY